ncbi:mediator of RNA polymerase II transcription subunit 27 [Trichonephila clavipes]|nr:mediator of RNA polymerase II transcription subunit 27 [Trichonephila clavipes]
MLRGLIIDWVIVKGYNEEFYNENDKLDMWSGSRYLVFQKVTEHANAAMLHFYSPNLPELAVRSFLTWIRSYGNLFTAPCHVAREFDIAHSIVSRLWKSFKTTGMCSRRYGGGRVRSTTPAEDRYIVLSAKRNRRTTAQQVANQFLAASGKQISRKTVARRLRG